MARYTDPELTNPTSHPLDGPINFAFGPPRLFDTFSSAFVTPVLNGDTYPGESFQATPAHYNDTAITALQVIDAWGANFRIGNALKYLCRHEKKGNAVADLRKAAEYIRLEIERLEA